LEDQGLFGYGAMPLVATGGANGATPLVAIGGAILLFDPI